MPGPWRTTQFLSPIHADKVSTLPRNHLDTSLSHASRSFPPCTELLSPRMASLLLCLENFGDGLGVKISVDHGRKSEAFGFTVDFINLSCAERPQLSQRWI